MEQHIIDFEERIEKLLESVRKEREEAINIIRKLVKSTFDPMSQQVVNTKMYGSMASDLAIDSSDVDLAVIGLSFKGDKNKQISLMKKLYEKLRLVKCKQEVELVETASVPVIKLKMDLEMISEQLEKLTEYSQQSRRVKIDPVLRYLGIDITFEDMS